MTLKVNFYDFQAFSMYSARHEKCGTFGCYIVIGGFQRFQQVSADITSIDQNKLQFFLIVTARLFPKNSVKIFRFYICGL